MGKTPEQIIADKVAADKLAADKVAADKLAADKVAADKLAADKVAADKLAADKVAADKLAAKKNFKKEYIVCVTGFMALGKMFRANQKINSKIYHDHIEKWLEKRLIK